MTGSEAIQKSKYFNLTENWGNPDNVSPVLVVALDRFRHELNVPVHISPIPGAVYAENAGHAENSWHYCIPHRNEWAMAADVFPEGDLYKAWLLAVELVEFKGIGLYPFASWAGRPYQGMLHLDIRYPCIKKSLWWKDASGQYRYFHDGLMDLQAAASILEMKRR